MYYRIQTSKPSTVLKSIFQKMFLIGKEKAQNIIDKTFQVKLLIEILQANHEIDLR